MPRYPAQGRAITDEPVIGADRSFQTRHDLLPEF
jgi:hypothetical protein